MILYNVTIKVDPDIQGEWLEWMQTTHIPDVLATGCFTGYRMYRLLEQDESEGITYAIQYFCPSMEVYQRYVEQFAPALQEEHSQRYKGKFVAFRTLLEAV